MWAFGLIAFVFVFFSAESAVAGGVDNVCFDDKNAFLTHAPKGWVKDTKKAKELGLCVVYHLKGKNFASSPAVISSRLVSTDLEGYFAVDKILGENSKTLKANPGGEKLEVSRQTGIINESNLAFYVNHFRFGPKPNEFEAVAYYPAKKAVFIVVLSARKEKDFDAQKGRLTDFLATIKPLTQDELKKLRSN